MYSWLCVIYQMKTCHSRSEFHLLFKAHMGVGVMGTPQFIKATGCLPPCTYDDFALKINTIQNVNFLRGHGEGAMGVMVVRESTDTKIHK